MGWLGEAVFMKGREEGEGEARSKRWLWRRCRKGEEGKVGGWFVINMWLACLYVVLGRLVNQRFTDD